MSNEVVRAVFKCPDEYKAVFKKSKCLLTVSVGQEVHEGGKFAATIGLVNNAFESCTICVDDSLQRHSMGLSVNATAEMMYDKSILEGDRWLTRNKHYYERLEIPFNIIRWNRWLKHDKFFETRAKIIHELDVNPEYNASFVDSIQEFLRRFERRLDPNIKFDHNHGFKVCKDYLIEECTALCLWQQDGYHFEVYPSKRNEAMSMTHELFVQPNAPNLLHPVAIKFKNRKQLKPQQFISDVPEIKVIEATA